MNPDKKPFKRDKKAGLLKDIDEEFVKETKEYWLRHYGKSIDPLLNIVFANLTGKKDVRVAPPVPVLWNEIIPYFNDMNIRVGYSDKNIYDKLIAAPRSVESVLKRIRGYYYDKDNNLLTPNNALKILDNYKEDLIIKPRNSDNGLGIKKAKYNENNHTLDGKPLTIDLIEKEFGYNLVVQKVIKQHKLMGAPHPSSVNTLRIVTLRWKTQIYYLLSYIRIGVNNNVMDNSGTGGIVVGINDEGQFYNYAIDRDLNVFHEHPSTGFSFKEMKEVPGFDESISYVKKLHERILHHDLVSWDIAIDEEAKPVFMEMNFRGPTFIYQLASQKPIFGDLTDEILEHIKEKRNISNRNSDSDYSRLMKKYKKLKKENNKLVNYLKTQGKKPEDFRKFILEKDDKIFKLQKENIQQAKKLSKLKSKIDYMENSKSWKLTAPLRKIKK